MILAEYIVGAENLQPLQHAASISLLPVLRELSYWKLIVMILAEYIVGAENLQPIQYAARMVAKPPR